jgi:hypothetical protein
MLTQIALAVLWIFIQEYLSYDEVYDSIANELKSLELPMERLVFRVKKDRI